MDKLRVLLANEPRSYREAMAFAFAMLRPLVEVVAVESKDLDHEMGRFGPHLVICSRVTPRVEAEASVWVELYPDGGALSSISFGGVVSNVDGVELNDLLSLVDRTEATLGVAAKKR